MYTECQPTEMYVHTLPFKSLGSPRQFSVFLENSYSFQLQFCANQWRCVHRGRKGAAPPRIFRKKKLKKYILENKIKYDIPNYFSKKCTVLTR